MTERSKLGVHLVLASASPRRRQLLARLGVPFDVAPADVDEDSDVRERAERVARRLARAKAVAASAQQPDAAVLAADTVVGYRGRLLGKPRDAGEAAAMLRLLRARRHRVVTAIAVVLPGRKTPLISHVTTGVWMRQYADSEIDASIARGDPFDKAGAYAIQDETFRPVELYEGCYCNVVGLPLWTAAALLRRAGVSVSASVADLPPQCALCPERH